MNQPKTTGKISRDDLVAQLRTLQGDVDEKVSEAKPKLITIAIASGVVILVAAYLLGKRKGRRKSTIVEIRRL